MTTEEIAKLRKRYDTLVLRQKQLLNNSYELERIAKEMRDTAGLVNQELNVVWEALEAVNAIDDSKAFGDND